MRMPSRSGQRGFTLIEVLVAGTLGLLVAGAAGSLLQGASRNFRQNDRLTLLQDELGYAMAQLSQDLEMAGHWGQLHDPSRIRPDASLTVATDCGASGEAWAYGNLTALDVTDNATAASASARHQCLEQGDLRVGTDVIAIKRVLGRAAGSDTDTSAMTAGMVYLRAGHLSVRGGSPTGLLYVQGRGTGATVSAPYRNWEYQAAVYYVQNYTVSASESPRKPALCRKVLRAAAGGPAFQRECLAQGVEDLQIEVGIDSDEDGAANHFVSSPSAAELTQVVSVRLYLLARSAEPDHSYQNMKTYRIGNAAAQKFDGADAHYYRKTLSSEIVLRNPRAMQGLAYR